MRLGIWPDLRLRTKGLIVIAFPATATVLIACASYILGTRASAAEQAVIHNLEAGRQIQRLNTYAAESRAQLRGYFLTGQEEFANQTRANVAAFDAALTRLSDLTAADVWETKQVDEIAAQQRWSVEHIFGALARFRSGSLPPEALQSAVRAMEAKHAQMEKVTQAIEERQERSLATQLGDVGRLHTELRATTGVCVIFGVLGGVLVSLLFASGITNRVGRLQANVSRLATGGALEALPGGRDEIGLLSEGVGRAAEVLRQKTAALENALHGIARVDQTGRYLSFNQAYAEIANLSDSEARGNFIDTLHTDDRAHVEAAVNHMRSAGSAELETRLAASSGAIIDVAMTFLPVSGAPGADYYVFARDITPRKEIEAALVRAKDAALAASLAKNDFLAKISHDIRTPLNAILGGANLLSETPLSPDQQEYVNLFQRNSARLVTLINDFLDFSRIEAGALRVEKIPFPIRRTVEEAVATFRDPAARKGIGLEVKIGSDVPDGALGDPLRVQQIIVNLVSNAIKFTEQGRVSLTVQRNTGSAGERLSFEVSDTGPGIPAEDRERVFAPFTQLTKQPPAGLVGSGLGLTICRELVERMGGEIGVSSQPGQGSLFYFSFPLEAASVPEVTPAAEQRLESALESSRAASTNRKVQLLIADDGEDNRLLLSHYLRKEPVDVKFVSNGQQAVDAVLAGPHFDLIFMDLDMPVMDGYQATRSIVEWQKSQGQIPTPIVALSAHAMSGAQQASLQAGCVTHVAKPVDKPTLLKVIQRYARLQAARQPESDELAEGIAALVPKYLASKPKQIEDARTSLALKDFDPIWRFGHNLKGTGRGYGFPPIEELGKELELAASTHDEASIAQHLEALYRFVSLEQAQPELAGSPRT